MYNLLRHVSAPQTLILVIIHVCMTLRKSLSGLVCVSVVTLDMTALTSVTTSPLARPHPLPVAVLAVLVESVSV
jgi:hypothetical protein